MKKVMDTITTEEAIVEAKKKGVTISKPTVINWVIKYGLGKRLVGRWYIDKKRFIDFLSNKGWKKYSGKYKEKK